MYLALPQMPKGFGLPKWAKSAGNYLFITCAIVLLLFHAPVVSKIMVGFLVVPLLLYLSSWVFYVAVATATLVAGKLGRTAEVLPPKWGQDIILAMGGWIGLVPNAVFLVWGLSYLNIYHVHRISLIARIVWGSWFVLGCVVAVVNGVGQWSWERRMSRGVEP